MSIEEIIGQLENNKSVFNSLLVTKKEAQYLWRPKPEKWNLLEIVCHLYDEERDDFKARVKHAIETPLSPLVPIDPEGWVKKRNYISKTYNVTLQAFLEERDKSINWLRSQTHANWESELMHPELRNMSAKLLLANWLTHDYLHIKQILNYEYHYLKEKTNLDMSYAGNW